MSDLATSRVGYWLFYTQRCVEYAFSEVLRRHCEERRKPYIVTPAQWGLLTLLDEEDGLPIGIVSQKRGLDAPTVTGIVKRLEQSGLVERLHNRADRRVVKVYLTAEGRNIVQSLLTIMDDWNETLLHGFSQTERETLLEQLQQIVANISDAESGIGDRFGLLPDHLLHHYR
ncbi:MAG TPA: MarR family transcriptional regulator [Ktedonobacteraceae bacterium]|jgi:DNA-binding MarR family transcriptional regulator|nr:MarR family transcriptional regulator [Ktedonobacteraceae bacterium]